MAAGRGLATGAPDQWRAAVHRAYHLVEAVQTPDADAARSAIATALADSRRRCWADVELTLLYALAVDAVTNLPEAAEASCARLVDAAESAGETALLAAGLGIRAELALRRGDVVSFARDASRGAVLLDSDGDPLARASGLVSVAVAYEALNLWELGDELYTRAEQLLPLCDDDVLEPVLGLNRALTWFWWTAALLEVGEDRAAHLGTDAGPEGGADVAPHQGPPTVPKPAAGGVARLPASWWRELRVSRLSRRALLGEATEADLGTLVALGDGLGTSDWLPGLQLHLGLAHACLRTDRLDEADRHVRCAQDLALVNGTVFQQSFADWTALLVEERRDPTSGTAARAYASRLARLRWDERLGRLEAARESILAERMRAEHEHLVRRALEDPLTGLGNRRALDERLDYLRATVSPAGPVAMLVVDVDRFKRVNDAYGHEVGDQVLRRVGTLVASVLRSEDLAVRLGGDEFGALIAGAPVPAVRARADRIGQLVDAEPWAALRPGLQVTVSVGAACGAGPGELEGLYARADRALYDAKEEGRGRLRVAT